MKQGFVKAASATPAIRVADPVYNAQVYPVIHSSGNTTIFAP